MASKHSNTDSTVVKVWLRDTITLYVVVFYVAGLVFLAAVPVLLMRATDSLFPLLMYPPIAALAVRLVMLLPDDSDEGYGFTRPEGSDDE